MTDKIKLSILNKDSLELKSLTVLLPMHKKDIIKGISKWLEDTL